MILPDEIGSQHARRAQVAGLPDRTHLGAIVAADFFSVKELDATL